MPGICGASLVSPCPEGTGEAPGPRWGHKKSWKGAGTEARSLRSRGGVRGGGAGTEPGWGRGAGACECSFSLRNTEGCPKCSSQMIIGIYVALLGDVLKGREWRWQYNGSLAAWSPEDGDELKI